MSTYYLNNLADASGDGTTSALTGANCAFDTITAAQTVLNALGDNGSGDTVMVYEGSGASYGRWTETDQARTDWLKWIAVTGQNPVFKDFYISTLSFDVYIELDGITFEKDGDPHANASGILLYCKGDFCEYKNLTIRGEGYKLIDGTTNTTAISLKSYQNVTNCVINAKDGEDFSFRYGVHINSSDTNVRNISADITKTYDAVYLERSRNARLYDMSIHDINRVGVILRDATGTTIEDTEIYNLNPVPAFTDSTSGATWTGSSKTITKAGGSPETWDTSWGGTDHVARITHGGGYKEATNASSSRLYTLLPIASATASTIVLSHDELGGDLTDITKVEVWSPIGHSDLIQFQNVFGITVDNTIIRRVDAHDCYGKGMYLNPRGGNGLTIENCSVYNNDNNDDLRLRGPATGFIGIYVNKDIVGTVDFRNNTIDEISGECAFTSFTGNIIKDIELNYNGGNTSFTTESHNIWAGEGADMSTYTPDASTTVLGTDSDAYTTYNALFSSVATYDYNLSSSSTAIDYDESGNAPLVDILGVARDASPDAGAYEYVAVPKEWYSSIDGGGYSSIDGGGYSSIGGGGYKTSDGGGYNHT